MRRRDVLAAGQPVRRAAKFELDVNGNRRALEPRSSSSRASEVIE